MYSNLTIFDGFVAIPSKKVVSKITSFFLQESPQNRQKSSIWLTVLKLPDSAVFKTPEIF